MTSWNSQFKDRNAKIQWQQYETPSSARCIPFITYKFIYNIHIFTPGKKVTNSASVLLAANKRSQRAFLGSAWATLVRVSLPTHGSAFVLLPLASLYMLCIHLFSVPCSPQWYSMDQSLLPGLDKVIHVHSFCHAHTPHPCPCPERNLLFPVLV